MYVVYITMLVGLTSLAVLSDIIRDKVPNYLIVIGLVVGCIYHIMTYGVIGIAYYLLGVITPTLTLFLLYVIKALGAGDIKLLSMLGGIIGLKGVLWCMFYSFILGGIISIFILLYNRNFLSRIKSAFFYFQRLFIYRSFAPYERGGKESTIHFTIPILISVMIYIGGYY